VKSLTPEQVASKWATNLSGATTSITAGVNALQVAPGQAAARQKAAYVQNVQAHADKWAANVASVSLQSWQQDMINKGLPRISTGATAAQPKMAQFMQQLLPYIANQVQTLPPRGNLAQNTQRAVAWINAMANFKKT
jgi:hypothetical protein